FRTPTSSLSHNHFLHYVLPNYWCNSDQERIQKTALAVSAFMPIEKKRAHANRSNKLVLSEHIKALLNLAEDKAALTQTIFSNIEDRKSTRLNSSHVSIS